MYLRKDMSFLSSFNISSVNRSSCGPVHEHLEDATLLTRSCYFPFIIRGTEIFSGSCIHSPVLVFCRASTSILPLMQTWALWGRGTSIRVSLQKKWSDIQFTPWCFLVYNNGGYLEAANTCAELSMMKAVTEVKTLPNYAAGEVCAHL